MMFTDKLKIVNSSDTLKLHQFTSSGVTQLTKSLASFTHYNGL